MAHFSSPDGHIRFSGQQMSLGIGQTIELGLWGYEESPGVDLDIEIDDPSVVAFDGLPRNSGNVRIVRLRSKSLGSTKLSARSRTEAVWDAVHISVVRTRMDKPQLTIAPSAVLRGAAESGKLVFGSWVLQQQFQKINDGEFSFEGRRVHHSAELEQLVMTLVRQGPIGVMRMFAAPNQGPHGELVGKEYVCRAIDITSYCGLRIHSADSPSTQIEAVGRLLRSLPTNIVVDIGFPRPLGQDRFDASRDVFFPVRDQATALLCKAGKISLSPRDLLEPAKRSILGALAGKKVGLMYPDGADHIHLKVVKPA